MEGKTAEQPVNPIPQRTKNHYGNMEWAGTSEKRDMIYG
jgi:hypothetical protein